jgi:protein-tyrosine phosphatase
MKVLPTIYSIEGPWKGQLAIVPRPRGEDWLEDEVQAWREGGLDVIVSLLTASEARELSLADEAALVQAKGLRFLQFPIPDYSVPSSFESTLAFVEKLDEGLARGENVAIHCRQGIGRSSLIAASVLVLRGTDPEAAFNQVATARGRPVPDTSEQREWVTNFAHYLHTATAQR